MEFDLTSILIALFAAGVAIYATWRAERRFPNLGEITEKVQLGVALLPEIRDLVRNFEANLKNGMIDESEVVRHVTATLHSRYPTLDLEAIRLTVRGVVNTIANKQHAP